MRGILVSSFVLLGLGLLSCGGNELDRATIEALFEIDPRAAGPLAADRPLVRLGEQLFRDPALSLDGSRSCASCHELAGARYGSGREPRWTVGTDGVERRRDVPALYDAGRQIVWGWDGWFEDPVRARLEDAVARCLENLTGRQPASLAENDAVPRGTGARDRGQRIEALAAWLRTLRTLGRWDRFVEGEQGALDASERHGLEVFVRVGCAACHATRLLGGRSMHPLGPALPWPTADPGRFAVTGQERDRACFEAPPLRLSAHTAPYFHDGSVSELSEAIRLMARHELGAELLGEEVAAIESFLRAAGDLDPR